jgi:hypothetical protein
MFQWENIDGRVVLTHVTCACGCGQMVKVKPVYFSPACRLSARRKRGK